jgi:hypothetical protein
MPLPMERVVVQLSPVDKRRILAKAKKLGLSMSELMRRATFSYTSQAEDADLGALADRAKTSADSAVTAIDDALCFIAASNMRMAVMERSALVKYGKPMRP